uniref:Uncharacterized protein n=1 Tax=Bubo bubo TaxID=30461 RepID=A0A8C0IHN6_BUBBB
RPGPAVGGGHRRRCRGDNAGGSFPWCWTRRDGRAWRGALERAETLRNQKHKRDSGWEAPGPAGTRAVAPARGQGKGPLRPPPVPGEAFLEPVPSSTINQKSLLLTKKAFFLLLPSRRRPQPPWSTLPPPARPVSAQLAAGTSCPPTSYFCDFQRWS